MCFVTFTPMHRTTIPLEGPVERELRRLALHEQRSFKELVNELLKRALKSYSSTKTQKNNFQWHTMKGQPAVFFDPADRSTYLDLISKQVK